MRIAISGSHRVGKSTLVEALGDALVGYATVDEPYHQLVEQGHDSPRRRRSRTSSSSSAARSRISAPPTTTCCSIATGGVQARVDQVLSRVRAG